MLLVQMEVHAQEAAVLQVLKSSYATTALQRCAELGCKSDALLWVQQILLTLALTACAPDNGCSLRARLHQGLMSHACGSLTGYEALISISSSEAGCLSVAGHVCQACKASAERLPRPSKPHRADWPWHCNLSDKLAAASPDGAG